MKRLHNALIDGPKTNRKYVAQNRAPKQESTLAKRLHGQTTPASGSKADKGDVRVQRVLRIEAKTTTKKSFRVDLNMIRKIEDAGMPHNEIPAIVIEFIDENGHPLKEIAVVPTYLLEVIADV